MGGTRVWQKIEYTEKASANTAGERPRAAGPTRTVHLSPAPDQPKTAPTPMEVDTATAEGTPSRVVVLWFRNDLRLRDNPLFHHPALKQAEAVLPVFCFDPRHFAPNHALHPRWGKAAGTLTKTGPLRARFLVESVAELRRGLQSLRSDLLALQGKPEELLPQLAAQLAKKGSSVKVLCQKEVAHEEAACEGGVQRALERLGSSLESAWGAQTLYGLEDLPFDASALPEPFTSFRNVVESKRKPVAIHKEWPRPSRLPPFLPAELLEKAGVSQAVLELASVEAALRRLGFSETETALSIDGRCANNFAGGEGAGLERLEEFVREGLATYKQTRDGFLGANYSSKLSPWIAHGCVSPRTVYWRVAKYEDEHGETLDTYWLTFELKWRDFFRFFCVKHGKRIFLRDGPANKWISWKKDAELFDRWCQGMTGVPFVDAHMRELKLTGFMSNRGRQCVASFLTQDLGLDWRLGAQWFEHALLDHDVYSNYGNWVAAAGIGSRGQRINKFNMAKQAQQYDPQAEFIKLWVPEVSKLPARMAISPWETGEEALARAGCRVPGDYPRAVTHPAHSMEARQHNKQRNQAEHAEVTTAGYPIAKRRWHHGRSGAYLAS